MSYRTDRQQVTGLGSAKDGVGHWWSQRVTAVALAILSIFFVIPFVQNLGADHAAVLESYRHPFHAIIAILFIATGCYHLKLGLQVVIEDYVHGPAIRTASLLANTLLCWFFGLAGVFAVARIAFSG